MIIMNPSDLPKAEDLVCNLCRYPGSDLRLLGCGCNIHARCAPLSLVLDVQGQSRQEYGTFPAPNRSQSTICPVCRSGPITGIYLVPLCFRDLERAIELRKTCSRAEAKNSASGKRKHPRDESPEIHAETAYLLLSNSRSSLSSSSGLSDREQQRTGRWTEEEISCVDHLVTSFDQGALPLPHGIKLNEFLGDMLICKSSRLTKKMKNAKLSTRSFVLCGPQSLSGKNDRGVLSSLQEKFLMSVPSEPTQLELRFNMTKQWRTHFSNLCVQIGYPFLDGKDWIASLEEMERRASNAEEVVRKVRRRRMGLALQTDGGSSANPSVFIRGHKADSAATQLQPILSQGINSRNISTDEENTEPPGNGDDDMFAMLDFSGDTTTSAQHEGRQSTLSDEFRRPRTFSEDFDAVLSDLMDPAEPAMAPATKENKIPALNESSSPNHSCGPFLDAIIMYMESKNLPFQHADVWVPTFLPRDTNGPSKAVDTEQLRLVHASHATRGDLDDSLAYAMHEFGVYSDNFSFEPGHGLPGRVYSSGKVQWETSIDESDPKHFERSGGAKVYGVRTAIGIPLNTPLVGRIVIALYSRDAVPENMALAMDCTNELIRYSPEPRWKLVIEMNNGSATQAANPFEQLSSVNYAATTSSIVTTGSSIQIPKAASSPAGFPTQLVGCNSPNAQSETRLDVEEQRIVSLLGEHMPLLQSLAGESSSSMSNSANLLPQFMSIRLLLLRPSSRRSTQENELIDILKNSFRAYGKDNRRSGAELANLLANDWVCLKSSFSSAVLDASLEPNPMPPTRRPSAGAAPKLPQPMMSSNNSTPPSATPLPNPPSQFVSPNGSMGNMFGYNDRSNNRQIGSMKSNQIPPRLGSQFDNGTFRQSSIGSSDSQFSNGVYRRSSVGSSDSPFDNGAYRRSSVGSAASHRGSFTDNSQPSIQPQTVQSSGPKDPGKPMCQQPSVVH